MACHVGIPTCGVRLACGLHTTAYNSVQQRADTAPTRTSTNTLFGPVCQLRRPPILAILASLAAEQACLPTSVSHLPIVDPTSYVVSVLTVLLCSFPPLLAFPFRCSLFLGSKRGWQPILLRRSRFPLARFCCGYLHTRHFVLFVLCVLFVFSPSYFPHSSDVLVP